MPRLRLGRDAKVYIHGSAFTAAGLVEVARTKDITINDEADDVTGSARDLEYNIHDMGAKEFSVEFERNIEADDDAADEVLLQTAYNDNSELYVVVCRAAKTVDSGDAIKFVGKVFSDSMDLPEGDHGKRKYVLKPTDPSNPPTRVATPLS